MKTLFLTCFLFLAQMLIAKESLDEVLIYPTIGNIKAEVRVVAFLEPKCPDSKAYNNETFPKLKKEYIDTNQISYTVIPVSFLYKSEIAADALLCVYHQDENKIGPDLFFKYLDYIYQNQLAERKDWATEEQMLKYAGAASQNIDIAKLKGCIENKRFQKQIEENTILGNLLLGKVTTPTLFVNGKRIKNKDDTVDYEDLKQALDTALGKEKALQESSSDGPK